MKTIAPLLALVLLLLGCAQTPASSTGEGSFPVPASAFAPRHYSCLRATEVPVIDGRLDDAAWRAAPFTEEFIDIEGDAKPKPRFRTRAKMLWDEEYLYIGAVLEDPHVRGTLTKRDSVVYYDNDFEVFIDPDGDTHEYYELELNALGTEWDLLIPYPYRDGGHGINAWDIKGLRTAVHIEGTLNDPSDTDEGWSVEIAIPFAVLKECANMPCPPRPGDIWRINFSRVQWQEQVVAGKYEKVRDPETGDPVAENNWVWSPQGLINMHYPERWGFVTFVADEPVAFELRPEDRMAEALQWVYYAERRFHAAHGRYAESLSELGISNPPRHVKLEATTHRFEAELTNDGVTLRITEDGRIRRIAPEDAE